MLTTVYLVFLDLGCFDTHFGFQLETMDHPAQRADHVGRNATHILHFLRGKPSIHVQKGP